MENPNRNRKEYSIFELVVGNVIIILWIGLGAAALGLFNLFAAIGFFALTAFLIFFEIGKHGCVTCYYCKTCTIGMGKLPEFFFKPEGTANVNKKALRIFPFVFLLLSLVPSVFVVFSIVQEFAYLKLALLVGLLAFSIYSGTVRRRNLLQ